MHTTCGDLSDIDMMETAISNEGEQSDNKQSKALFSLSQTREQEIPSSRACVDALIDGTDTSRILEASNIADASLRFPKNLGEMDPRQRMS